MRDINLLLGCITSSAVEWLKVTVPQDVKSKQVNFIYVSLTEHVLKKTSLKICRLKSSAKYIAYHHLTWRVMTFYFCFLFHSFVATACLHIASVLAQF